MLLFCRFCRCKFLLLVSNVTNDFALGFVALDFANASSDGKIFTSGYVALGVGETRADENLLL